MVLYDLPNLVSRFGGVIIRYLGSISTSDCTLDAEITHRVVAANSAFQQLRQSNIRSSRLWRCQSHCSLWCYVSSAVFCKDLGVVQLQSFGYMFSGGLLVGAFVAFP